MDVKRRSRYERSAEKPWTKDEVREALKGKVFPKLRRQGIAAFADGACCHNGEMAAMQKTMSRVGAWGCVFVHIRDRDEFNAEDVVFYLSFTAFDDGSESDESMDDSQLKVAEDLIWVLDFYCIPYHWSGSIDMRVVVGAYVGERFGLSPTDEMFDHESWKEANLRHRRPRGCPVGPAVGLDGEHQRH
jgi:hypothetical protein